MAGLVKDCGHISQREKTHNIPFEIVYNCFKTIKMNSRVGCYGASLEEGGGKLPKPTWCANAKQRSGCGLSPYLNGGCHEKIQ